MEKPKHEKKIIPLDYTDNNSDSPKNEELNKALSTPFISDSLGRNLSSLVTNDAQLLSKGLNQIDFKKIQDLANINSRLAIDSALDSIKNLPSITDELHNILSYNYKSFGDLLTSTTAIRNILGSEPKIIDKDELKKEIINFENATVNVIEANKNASLASRTSEYGYQYLKNNTDLRRKFEGSLINMTVVSIDIRSSTQLMLNAKSPKDFAAFIADLSNSLSALVMRSCGVYDKFTGDGLLCFFPNFYSGEDHIYLALLCAEACHKIFQTLYAKHYDKFCSVRADVGLGIGVDTGETYLTFVNNEPTVIGTPVVYACRLSSAPCNTTYINQQVYEVIKNKYQDYFEITPCEIEFKGQGKMRVYKCVFSKKLDPMPLPDWATADMKDDKEAKE